MSPSIKRPAPTGRVHRLPASGNTALAASALIQAALGIEFFLSGMNKFADPNFVRNFTLFVNGSPGTRDGVMAPLIHALVLPNIAFFATLTKYTEIALGIVRLKWAAAVSPAPWVANMATKRPSPWSRPWPGSPLPACRLRSPC